jgi:hypothetical protein
VSAAAAAAAAAAASPVPRTPPNLLSSSNAVLFRGRRRVGRHGRGVGGTETDDIKTRFCVSRSAPPPKRLASAAWRQHVKSTPIHTHCTLSFGAPPYFHTRTRLWLQHAAHMPMLCMAPRQSRRPVRRRVCRRKRATPCSSPRTCSRRRWTRAMAPTLSSLRGACRHDPRVL